MKRFFAMFIDVTILVVFFYFYTIPFTIPSNGFGLQFSWVLLYLAYNFTADYFYNGISIGKKIAGLKEESYKPEKRMLYCITHGLFRLIFFIILPITIIYYIISKGKIPYDKLYEK